MKTMRSLIFAVAFLSAFSLAKAADPVIGTWTFESAKSKYTSQAPPKSETRTYSQSDDGSISLSSKAVQSNSHVTEWKIKKNGKVVETGRRTVSKDGKTLTLIERGTDARGAKFTDVVVYDKQ